MTRHIDTYWAIIGACPFDGGQTWWSEVSETIPRDDPYGDHPDKWNRWNVKVAHVDDDGSTIDWHTFTHASIVRACTAILEGIAGHHFRSAVTDNARELLYGDPDSVDFDSDTADVVLQIAAFGEVRYS